MPKGKPATLEEMPIAELRDQMANYERASLKITRRNEKGQIATVYSDVVKTLDEILVLDGWLKANAGGGRFRIEVRDPQDKSKYLVQPFHLGVEGPPRPPRYLGNPAHMGGAPQTPYAQESPMSYDPNQPPGPPGYGNVHQTPFYGHQDPYAPPPPRWLNGVHPSQRSGYMPAARYRHDSPAPGATVASDALAIRQLEEQRAEAKAQIAKLEEQNKALLDRLDRMAEEAKLERERAREERHRLELEQLRKEMELSRQPQQKNGGTGDMIAALAPFAPVLSAMITSRESSGSKSMELQQQGLMSLMNATLTQANKPDQTMEMFKTMVLPMIMKEQESKSPEAQAALFNSMVENNLNSVAMMAQLIEAFASAGGDEPWWLPMVRETMTGVVGMTEAYMQGKGSLPGQAPMRPLPEPNPQALPMGQPQVAGASGYSTVDLDAPPMRGMQDIAQAAPAQPAPRQAPQPAVVIETPAPDVSSVPSELDEMEAGLLELASPVQRLMLRQLPEDFQTQEWRICVLALHVWEDPNEVADLISGHINHLMHTGALPEALLDIEQDPARALDRVLAPMPISKEDPKFAARVLQGVIDALIEDNVLPKPKPMVIDAQGEEVTQATA